MLDCSDFLNEQIKKDFYIDVLLVFLFLIWKSLLMYGF